jgi:predicted porin
LWTRHGILNSSKCNFEEILMMKRTLIALAVAATVVTPLAAQAAPTVYGKLNLSVDRISDDLKSSVFQVDSNASRLGVKGEESLITDLSVIYQIEYEVNGSGATAPYNASTDLAARNRFVGLKSPYGTVKLGRFDSYFKAVGQAVDPFADQLADNSNVLGGKDRLSSVIAYESPKMFDALNFNVLIQPGQASTANGATPPVAADNGIADALSASLVYSDSLGLSAALAYDKGVMSKFAALTGVAVAGGVSVNGANAVGGTGAYLPGDTVGTARTDALRVTGGYKNKDLGLSLNAMFQQSKRSNAYNYSNGAAYAAATATTAIKPKETGWLVSATWTFADNWTAKGSYVASTTEFDGNKVKDIDLSQVSLGLDYNFTKMTKVYGLASVLNTKNKNILVANPVTGLSDDVSRTFTSVGIEHQF